MSHRVGVYLRLSRDDERQGESVSIENQREMLLRYCREQAWEVVEVFSDDGWSGTDFRRPGFLRMMEAVRCKRIDLVLVKDLSRLGRDYIEVGKYTDCVFPYYGCRFVALNDGVDTQRQNDDVAMIFKNVLNDIYARDTSKKIRAVRRSNAESGKFMGYKPPYGYVRSEEDKHRFVVEQETGEVVKRIFALRQEGWGCQAIADLLTQSEIPTPKDHATGNRGHPWRRETVRAMLQNEAYLGHMVQLKQERRSYKDHRQRQRPRETWARVEGTHTGIIDQKTWDAVQALEGTPALRRKIEDPFSGLLCCQRCGGRLRRVVNRKERGGEMRTYTYYICKGHCCISGDAVETLVERDVETWLKTGAQELPLQQTSRQQRRREQELAALRLRLYEDYALGKVTEDFYHQALEQWEAKERKITKPQERDWRQRLRLIQRILVGPKEAGRQEVQIQYRFCAPVLP